MLVFQKTCFVLLGVLCFLKTPVLKFALLPYYRRKVVLDSRVPLLEQKSLRIRLNKKRL